MTDEQTKQFTMLVEFLGSVLGPDYEITLYDLDSDPASVVAIANGRISGQTVGSPLPEVARDLVRRDAYRQSGYVANFTSYLSSGKAIRSSALFIQDSQGKPVGLLGINFDDSRYVSLYGSLLDLLHPAAFVKAQYASAQPSIARLLQPPTQKKSPPASEVIHNDVSSLIHDIFAETLSAWTVPPERLTQEERIAVITQLKNRGMFRLKGAVQYAAENLGCSQASIYRYLSKVKRQPEAGEKSWE